MAVRDELTTEYTEYTEKGRADMQPRERFIAALEHRPLPGRVPHFELAFFLTMEAFGKIHPSHRSYRQWDQMEEKERQLHRADIADLYVKTAERFEQSAIMFAAPTGKEEEVMRIADLIRAKTGDRYFLLIHGDATYGIPNGKNMMSFVERLSQEPDKLMAEAGDRVNKALGRAGRYKRHGALDGFALCADYCLNTGPFLSPAMFSEFVAPYLARLIKGYRDMGFYTIKHTDGNIMPIIGQLVQCAPHALHSLDPQAGVDIAEVSRLYGDKVCLIGNVNCGKLDTGADEEVIASARYALKHGMANGGGYVFSTSNCIYTGMRLARYELMLDVWRREGQP